MQLTNTSKFKTIIVLLLLNTFYANFALIRPQMGCIESLLFTYSAAPFLLIFSILIYYSNLYVKEIIESNYAYLIRLGKKENTFRSTVFLSILFNFLIFVLQLVLLLIVLNLFHSIDRKIDINFYNVAYTIYFICKAFVVVNIISYTNLLLLNLCNTNIISIFNICIHVYCLWGVNPITIHIHKFKIPLLIISFFHPYLYDSIFNEISSFLIFLILIYLFISLLKTICFRRKKDVQ